MANVLLCAESARRTKPLSYLADCAVELTAQGHAVTLVCPDVTRAHSMHEFEKAAIFPAPCSKDFVSADSIPRYAAKSQRSDRAALHNYSSILMTRGYGDPHTLAALLRSWLHFLATLDADCVIAEDAPTALIAAKLLNVPSVRIGHGFVMPPQTLPLAGISPWKESSDGAEIVGSRCRSEDKRLLSIVNQAVTNLAFEDIEFSEAHELFSDAAQWLVSWPELDHYGARDLPYVAQWGASDDVAIEPVWPNEADVKVFIEMNLDTPHITELLIQLTAIGESVLAVIPDASEEFIKQYRTGNLQIQRERVSIDAVVEQCDTIISDGSYDLTHQLLTLGVPSIIVPSCYESALFSYRLAKQKLCFAGPVMPSRLNTLNLLKAARKQGVEWANAAELASRYNDKNSSLVRLRDLITAKFRKT